MILRSLELAGFKSFADRTRIHFDPGVTAIVGPNGCGKSNVVDAIRWVLGETSARALRGGEMADVIFNGTERRRPLGLAEVSLTLSGCEDLEGWEGHEVAIGRRVFRDGKSEYLLNRRSCRLRDIQNLFVDTGVGTSFYSIMEQGKIDLLLSSKPEDRREVFEEAAGITKYKQQKREALRKLEQTETNLIRLTDVLDEQERQLASLQRQAQRARRYAELRHLLYVLDTQISRMQWVAYQKSWDLEYEQWRSLEEKKQAIHQELQRRQSKVTELRSQRVALSDEILTVRESLSKAEALRSETHLRISQNESRVEEWRRLQSQMEEELVILQDQRKKESTQVEASCADQEGASTRLSALTESLQSGNHRLSQAGTERSKAIAARRSADEEIARLELRLQALQEKEDSISREADSIHESLDQKQAQLRKADSQVAHLETKLDQQTQAVGSQKRKSEDLSARLIEAEQDLSEAERTREELSQALVEARDDVANCQARLEMLGRLQTLPTNTQMAENEELPISVLGPAAQFLDVQEEHFAAVEATLAHASRALVVGEWDDALSLLHSLESAEITGLTILVPSSPPPTLGKAPAGTLGWLLDHVVCRGPAAASLARLLSAVALVPDCDTATALHKAHPHLSLVTLEGHYFSADGLIHVPHPSSAETDAPSTPLRVEAEMRSLRTEVAHLQQVFQEQERASLEARTGAEAAQETVRTLQASVREAELAASQAEYERQLSHQSWEQAKDERERLARECAHAEASAQTLLKAHEQQRSEKETSLAELAQWKGKLPALQESEAIAIQSVEHAEETVSQLRLERALEERAAKVTHEQLVPARERLAALKSQIERRIREQADTEQRLQLTQAETQQFRETSEDTDTQILELKNQCDVLSLEEREKTTLLSEQETLLQEHSQNHARLTEEAARMEIGQSQTEMRRDHLAERMRNEYDCELADLPEHRHQVAEAIQQLRRHPPRTTKTEPLPATEEDDATFTLEIQPDPDWAWAEEQLPGLRQRLARFGSVNEDAISEAEELEERFSTVQRQHHDLVRAREELTEILTHINQTTRTLFTETFAQITNHFRDVFRELFGPDAHADLSLLDPDDPLESGIDIIAKPPGKKLRSITLLSGGERSLTAVALLFAIYRVKPSPFCILDELDAPLDEVNIGRFCQMLDQFCQKSQFIIVTHSKRTMSRADAIYGVSMQERGISQTLSMRLEKDE